MVQPLASPSPGCPQDWSWIWMRSPGRWPDGPRAEAPCPPPAERTISRKSSPGYSREKPPAHPCAPLSPTPTPDLRTIPAPKTWPGQATPTTPPACATRGTTTTGAAAIFPGGSPPPWCLPGRWPSRSWPGGGCSWERTSARSTASLTSSWRIGTACGLWRTRTFLCWMTRPGSRCGRLF